MNIDTGCIICGADLKYLQESRIMNCSICGDKDESNAQCQEGHFVCNSCHMADGFELIERYCIASDSHKPVERIDCTFSALNKECKQTSCKYFINN